MRTRLEAYNLHSLSSAKRSAPANLAGFIYSIVFPERRQEKSVFPGSCGSSPVVPQLRPEQGRAARVGAEGGRTGPVPGAPANAGSEEELCHPAAERVQLFRVRLTAGRRTPRI